MSTDRDESFLARWSRRKRSGEPDADAKLDVQAKAGDAKPEAATEPAFDIAKLPRIEDLTPASDFAQFLQKGVPDDLKRLALRRAWSLDPAIRDFVEVAENQYDWNVVGGVPGFGDLDAGTDLKALLLQATGQLPEAREAVAEAPADRGPADRSVAVVAPEQHGVAGSGPAGFDGPATTEDDARATAPLAQPAPARPQNNNPDLNQASIARRRARHGGALAGVSGTDADDMGA